MNTILIIEDNKEMAENISAILNLSQYNVLAAYDGKSGIEMVHRHNPDLILCDIMMPKLDGYSVLHILSADSTTAKIPFIFLTAKTEKNDFRMGMNMGADDYITKPFDGFELLKVIETRLKKNELLKSTYKNDLNDINLFFNHAKELTEFKKLSDHRHIRKFHKKEFIYLQGQTLNDLYFISKGQIKTYLLNNDGKELITGIHGEGDFLGYANLLEDKPSTENAVAMEPVEIAVIPKQDFITLLYTSKEIARKFIKILSNNLTEAENRLLELAYESVRERAAGALLKMSNQNSAHSKSDLISFSRKDIANIVGTATESLNRTLADFQDEGLIELAHEGIKILDYEKLGRVIRS